MKFEDIIHIKKEEGEENKKSTLSKIPPDFYQKAQEYIEELVDANKKITKRHSQEAILIQDELDYSLKYIDNIFTKRIRKILRIVAPKVAFSKNNSKNFSRDIENMVPQEQELFNQLLDAIIQAKRTTINPILGIDDDETEIPVHETQPEVEHQKPPEGEPIVVEIPHGKKKTISDRPELKLEIPETPKTELPEPYVGKPAQSGTTLPTEREGTPQEEAVRPAVEATPKVPDQEPTDKKQDVPDVSAADNTPATEKSSPQETKTQVTSPPLHKEEIGRDSDEKGKKDINKEYIVVRLLKDIPKFRGADGRNYILGAQDVAVLPKVNAKPLIKRKVAVQIEST